MQNQKSLRNKDKHTVDFGSVEESKENMDESEDLIGNKKPIFKSLVTRLQIASRLARSQRNSMEEETDVVADDIEIKNYRRNVSVKTQGSKKVSRPRSLTLRQFSRMSTGSIPRDYRRVLSNISDQSVNEDDDYENGIISDGKIHFWKQFCFDDAHPYLRVTPKVDIEFVAKVMHKCWDLNVPKIVTFIVSNKSQTTNWTNERQIKTFQKGLIDAAISTNMWIFTNGINSGVANLIGNAIKNETNKMQIKRTLKNRTNLTNLIGVTTEHDLRYGELLATNNKDHLNVENVGSSYHQDIYELNPNHTHFIVIKDQNKDTNCVDAFIMKFIQLLTREPVNKPQELIASTPDLLDSQVSVEATEVPVVSIVIEGDCQTARLVVDLIKAHVPVVILRGTGGVADIIAFAYLEIVHRCPNAWDLEFVDQYLKPMLTKKIIQYFSDLKDNTLTRNLLRDRIIECVRLHRTEDRTYLTIINLHNSSSCNLENLRQHLLSALLKSRHSSEMSDNFVKNLELTMDWNCPDVARNVIFAKNANNIVNLDKNLFESALIHPNREEFIELFLSLGFQLHKFVSPSRLNRLFKLIHDNEFFKTHCWESILGRPSCLRQPKYFIDNDLNWLIEILTGFDNFVNTEYLHLNVMGTYQHYNPHSAERKALNILTIWSVMQNRHQLAKVFWKHSDQPVHLALVISMMFDRLSWYAVDNNMKSDLKQKSKTFADFANGVLDICYNEDIFRANNVLNQSIHDWNYKTAVDIAANAQLRQFLAHPCCQKFLTNTFLGNIRLREINWGIFTIPAAIKILLCAFFVFPLFIWVRFKSKEIEIPDNSTADDEYEDSYDEIFREDNGSSSVITDNTIETDEVKVGYLNPSFAKSVANSYDTIIRSKNRFNNSIRGHMFVARPPPLCTMWAMFFSAPITKFYVSQLFYMLYLPLLSLSVIYPGCGLWKLDVLVCIWTTVLCIDYIRRTYIIVRKYTSVPVFLKCIEIASIIVFIILFSITRVFGIPIITPYQQKLTLSVGVLYFYYRLIGIYLPISPTLGPLLHRLKLMITVDFVNYMRMALLVILSNMVVMQAVLYPDTEISFEMFHKAFHRAFFALFLTPVVELETNEYCEQNRISEPLVDQCTLTGNYNTTSCANTGVWAYAFVIQYLVFLKLILSTLLAAIFTATATKLSTETDNIWKFQRYLLVIDFENRLPLPAPFSIFCYIYFIFQFIRNLFYKFCKCCANKKNSKVVISNLNESHERNKLTPEECIYWQQLATDYIEELKAQAAKDAIPYKQWESIQLISEDMEYEKKILREIKGKVMGLERLIMKEKLSNDLITAQDLSKTRLSHYSPYPGTLIIRVPLSDKYILWEALHIDYEPIAYSKPVDEFPHEMQPFVDEDLIQLKELHTRRPGSDIILPKYEWNSQHMDPNGQPINRISWQINADGTPLYYKLENSYIPRNPFGRTGLRGRGGLPRWGPNHYIILVITRWQKTRQLSDHSYSKYLELVVENRLDSDLNYLPERLVSSDDLFGEIQKLFKTDSQTNWVLPEMVTYFRSMCRTLPSLSSTTTDDSTDNGFQLKLIQNGYIDDCLNTDNAWKEAKVWHIHYESRDCLKKYFIDRKLIDWKLLADNLFVKMPLSQSYLVKLVAESLKADII